MDRASWGKPGTVYITYIKTTAEKLWEAITSPEFTKKYFFGRRIESDWKLGSAVTYWTPDGRVDVQGKILEINKPFMVAFTWNVEWIKPQLELPECVVEYKIEPIDASGQVTDSKNAIMMKFTMNEYHLGPIEEKYLEGGRQGWPLILSGLKSLLETGSALPEFKIPEPPAK